MEANGHADRAVWTNPKGNVRITYRTKVNAVDTMERSFLALRLIEQGSVAVVNAREMGRFCLERFCVSVEILRDGKWGAAVPFSWSVFEELTDEHAQGGWLVELGLFLYQKVVAAGDERAAFLEPRSETSSAPASPAAPLPGPQ